MVMKTCPRCNKTIVVNDYDTDFVCTCQSISNTEALNNEDYVDVTKDNWNLQGIGTNVLGQNVDKINKWGHRSSTHSTRQHYEYFTME